MRLPLLSLFLLLAACATVPRSEEYQVPFVTIDDKLEMKTTKPLPGDFGQIIMCIEFNDGVLCIAERGGQTARVFIPMGAP